MRSPHSATKVEPKFGLWRVTRVHDCADHYVAERKWFFKRESAARWAQVWMDYRWIMCWQVWDGTYT